MFTNEAKDLKDFQKKLKRPKKNHQSHFIDPKIHYEAFKLASTTKFPELVLNLEAPNHH
jgi:hypothetical protein